MEWTLWDRWILEGDLTVQVCFGATNHIPETVLLASMSVHLHSQSDIMLLVPGTRR
jgi:hypothetical protein